MSEEASQEPSALENAWSRFATYDHNANEAQRNFFRLRLAMIAVSIAATALAIIYSQYVEVSSTRPAVSDWRFPVWLLMIAMPVLGSGLAAGATKLSRGIGWISLRGAAEAIKREIYRYRCRIGGYGAEPALRDAKLADVVARVTTRLIGTEVINASLTPFSGQPLPPKGGVCERDDGFSDLGPAQYLDWRLGDQLAYFRGKSRQLDRRHRQFRWWIAGLGGAGTILAAAGQEIWVPVSVAIATALASYLELRNVETNLAAYNSAALGLDSVATWWSGLTPGAKADPASFAAVVERTEDLLGGENASWVQEMETVMAAADKREEGSK